MRTRGVDSCVDSAKTNRSPGLVFVNRFWLMWSWSSCRFVASGLKYSVGWPGSYSSLHDENLQRTKIFTNFGPFFQTYPFNKINFIHFFQTIYHSDSYRRTFSWKWKVWWKWNILNPHAESPFTVITAQKSSKWI